MHKYIRFDIDSKKTVACVVQKGEKSRHTTFKTDILLSVSCLLLLALTPSDFDAYLWT
jgi:hypothetical protein